MFYVVFTHLFTHTVWVSWFAYQHSLPCLFVVFYCSVSGMVVWDGGGWQKALRRQETSLDVGRTVPGR